jgi:WhiB family transcriptional regulator, redox-sensing transcriptional regulator
MGGLPVVPRVLPWRDQRLGGATVIPVAGRPAEACPAASGDQAPHDIRNHSQEGVEVDWRFRAACRTEDPELFFPIGSSGPVLRQLAEAEAVCRRCLVLLQCRLWAFSTGQETGVWGGLSASERPAMRRHDHTDLPLTHGPNATTAVRRGRCGSSRPAVTTHARSQISALGPPARAVTSGTCQTGADA